MYRSIRCIWTWLIISVVPQGNLSQNQWLLVNPEAVGYYRVWYDDDNYDLLANALKENLTVSFLFLQYKPFH